MKKLIIKVLILIIIIICGLAVLKSRGQVELHTDPFNEPTISSTLSVKVAERLFLGGVVDVFPNDDFTSVMGDLRFNVWSLDKKVDIDLYNGYSIGFGDGALSTAFYLTEHFYFNDFPLGLSIYQRFFMNGVVGVLYENRLGIVWNFYKKKKKSLEKQI